MVDAGVKVNKNVDRAAFLAKAAPEVKKFTDQLSPGLDAIITGLASN
jgi:hypothetical protein